MTTDPSPEALPDASELPDRLELQVHVGTATLVVQVGLPEGLGESLKAAGTHGPTVAADAAMIALTAMAEGLADLEEEGPRPTVGPLQLLGADGQPVPLPRHPSPSADHDGTRVSDQ